MAIPTSLAALVAHKAAVVGVTAVLGTGTAAITVAAVVQTQPSDSVFAEEPSTSITITEDADDETTTTAGSATNETTGDSTTPSTSETTRPAEDSTSSAADIEPTDDDAPEAGLVSCDEAVNHGEYVSSRARNKDNAEEADGRSMRDAARSDCGKPDPSTESEEDEDAESDESDDAESDESDDSEDAESDDNDDDEDDQDRRGNSGGRSDKRGPKDKSD